VEALCAAEASGGPQLSFSTLFDLDRAEVEAHLATFLYENADDTTHDFTPRAFIILEADGAPAATCAAWIEHPDPQESRNAVRAACWGHALGFDRLQHFRDRLELAAAIEIPRSAGCVQIDAVYVREAYRGQGLLALLIEAQLARFATAQPAPPVAQIVLMLENTRARRAYEKLGFAFKRETGSDNPLMPQILPGTGKLLLEKPLTSSD
jgi:GNAT superfamily N-acetyltransferase